MIQEGEIVSFLLCVGVLIFILANRLKLKRLPDSEILIVGFCLLFTHRILGILEEFLLKELLNLFQHMSFTCSAALLATWCWKVFGKEGSRL